MLSLQKTESIGNLAGRPRSLYLDTAVGKLVHGDLLAGIDAQMLQEILAQGNLSLGGYGKCAHWRVSFVSPECKVKIPYYQEAEIFLEVLRRPLTFVAG